VVKFFNAEKGYGFIVPKGKVGTAAPDVFVHISDVRRSGLTTPLRAKSSNTICMTTAADDPALKT
jgi:cold shock CspA family protein